MEIVKEAQKRNHPIDKKLLQAARDKSFRETAQRLIKEYKKQKKLFEKVKVRTQDKYTNTVILNNNIVRNLVHDFINQSTKSSQLHQLKENKITSLDYLNPSTTDNTLSVYTVILPLYDEKLGGYIQDPKTGYPVPYATFTLTLPSYAIAQHNLNRIIEHPASYNIIESLHELIPKSETKNDIEDIMTRIQSNGSIFIVSRRYQQPERYKSKSIRDVILTAQVFPNNKYINYEIVNTDNKLLIKALTSSIDTSYGCWATLLSSKLNHLKKYDTPEKVNKLLNKHFNRTKDIGFTTDEIIGFCQANRIQIKVFDTMDNNVASHYEDGRNKKVIYALIYNNHIYSIDNIHYLKHTKNLNDDIPHIYKIDSKPKDHTNTIMINDINQIQFTNDTYYYNGDLTTVLNHLIDNGLVPEVGYDGQLIKSISIHHKNNNTPIITKIITNASSTYQMTYESSAQMTAYSERMNQVRSLFISSRMLSRYTPETLYKLKKSLRAGVYGLFNDNIHEDSYDLDFNKMYAYQMLKLGKVPVINRFDSFQPYDNHPIEQLTMYLITPNDEFYIDDHKHDYVYINKMNNICFGYNLIEFNKHHRVPPYTIKEYLRPSKLEPTYEYIDEVFQSLYNDERLTKQQRKSIPNIVYGLLTKTSNKRTRAKIFLDEREAVLYTEMYGGTTYNMDTYTLYRNDKKNKLQEGFLPIALMILDNARMDMFKLTKLLKPYVSSIICDCLTIPESNVQKVIDTLNASHDYNIGTDVGQLKLTRREKYIHIDGYICIEPNEFDITKRFTTDTLNGIDSTLIEGLAGGAGKTTTAIQLTEGKPFLIVYGNRDITDKTDRDVRSKDSRAITLAQLFKISPNDKNDFNRRSGTYNNIVNDYDTIIFDEIYYTTPLELDYIKEFMENNPKKKYLLAGDIGQLDKLSSTLNPKIDRVNYMTTAVRSLANKHTLLKTVHRAHTQEDNEQLLEIALKRDKMSKQEFIKYLRTIFTFGPAKSSLSIVAFNYEADTMTKDIPYAVNTELICKNKDLKDSFAVYKRRYIITEITNDEITLKSSYDDKIKVYPFDNAFKHQYKHIDSMTCGTYQGQAIDEPYDIYNWDTAFTTKEWIYTALSRTRAISYVNFVE